MYKTIEELNKAIQSEHITVNWDTEDATHERGEPYNQGQDGRYVQDYICNVYLVDESENVYHVKLYYSNLEDTESFIELLSYEVVELYSINGEMVE